MYDTVPFECENKNSALRNSRLINWSRKNYRDQALVSFPEPGGKSICVARGAWGRENMRSWRAWGQE